VARYSLGLAYEQNGMLKEAIAEFLKAKSGTFPQELLTFLGHAYALSGKREQAKRALAELREQSGHRHVDPSSSDHMRRTPGYGSGLRMV